MSIFKKAIFYGLAGLTAFALNKASSQTLENKLNYSNLYPYKSSRGYETNKLSLSKKEAINAIDHLKHDLGLNETIAESEFSYAKLPLLRKKLIKLKDDNGILNEDYLNLVLRLNDDKKEKLLDLKYFLGACAFNSLAGYLGYHVTRDEIEGKPGYYRFIERFLYAATTVFLYEERNLKTALAFDMFATFGFGLDFGHYGVAELIPNSIKPKGWDGKGSFKRSVLGNKVTWAWFTPIGMLRGGLKHGRTEKPIAGDTLVAQFVVGLTIPISLILAD